MRSPNSFTTEDMIEFGCHGGGLAARRVLEACLVAGARLARRGEFTERAFLAGRLDLVQAEAVADIVAARTRKGLESALGQLEGRLSGRLSDLRERLIDLKAEVEALVDFDDLSGGDGGTRAVREAAAAARAETARLLAHCDLGVAVREGIAVAIVGKPNVGKSSLMNALLMRERSIVTPVPGTTRDAIEETIDLRGVPVRLIDTAGWHDAGDEAEEAGVERAKSAARGASFVLFVLDASTGVDERDRTIARALDPARVVAIENKIDLPPASDGVCLSELPSRAWLATARVSALTGDGLDTLRSTLVTVLLGGEPAEPVLLGNVRHIDALRCVDAALGRAAELVERSEAPEIIGVELNEAMLALGEITGETTPDDVLQRIFDRFCVGK